MDKGRSRSRVPGQFEATLSVQGRSVPVVTENLSLKGVLCVMPEGVAVAPGECCSVRFRLSHDIVIDIATHAVRVERGRLALAFEEMDAASFSHLRNMVRYSSADPDVIDAELAGVAREAG